MGHSISDADCIGASVGIYRAARTSGKDVHIVLNTIANIIKPLLNRLAEDEEYGKKLFIDNETAIQRITEGTLLIVVDNNRPSRTECPQLLQLAQHVVVLDHHRQSRDCIEGAVLIYVSLMHHLPVRWWQRYCSIIQIQSRFVRLMQMQCILELLWIQIIS